MITNCQLLVQSISEALFMLDKDGYILYANPATASITGFSPAELITKPLHLLYNNTEDHLKAEYELGLARKKGRFVSEGWRTRKDGSKFWGTLILAAINDPQQDGAGYSCLLSDLTEKKQTEIELHRSEERYRLMIENVKDYAIFMLDPDGNIVTWNEGARLIKGYAPAEIIGKHFSTFYTAYDLADKKPERELRIAMQTGKFEEEGWRVRKNGTVFWANIVITALYNDKNKHIGFSKVTRDLTERKEAEEWLRQSEERYRSLVEQVTDYGIFMMDEKGRIVSWNEGAKRIAGYTVDEIVGKYFSIFYTDEDILNGKPAYELKTAREEGKYEEEGWRLRKDGQLFWSSVVITAVYNQNGNHVGFSKVTRDLTERKEAERALRDSYERYRKLASELKILNNELAFANEELEQFTSIVSHDLQEPIRTIKSFLQLIDLKLGQEQTPEIKTYIGKAVKAASRMRELIQNLLHYAQLSKGTLLEENVSLSEIIQAALQNLNNAIEKSGAQISIENTVDTVMGDRVQLVQLIQNIIGNALKFVDAGRPQVRIRCTSENGHVKVAITDNGIGIDNGNLNNVFEIFRRLHPEPEYPGTGIGLAICKKIVDRHRGRIWPESEPGKGTTFYFTLQEKAKEHVVI